VWLLTHVVPHVAVPFLVVAGDADATVPHDVPQWAMAALEANPHFVCMWAQNGVPAAFPRLRVVPIGQDYHSQYLRVGGPWWPRATAGEQEAQLNALRAANPWPDRLPLVHMDAFARPNGTQGRQYDRHGAASRSVLIAALPSFESIVVGHNASRTTRFVMWGQRARFAFVLSPPGVGRDAHRTWEALALGCIPIVHALGIEEVFDGLPVVVVANWSLITPAAVSAWHAAFHPLARHPQFWEWVQWRSSARWYHTAIITGNCSVPDSKPRPPPRHWRTSNEPFVDGSDSDGSQPWPRELVDTLAQMGGRLLPLRVDS